MRHREIQAILFRDEQRCPRTGGGRHMRHATEAVAVLLLKDVDEALAAADVQPFSPGIVEEIVGVADAVEGGCFFSAGRVVHENLRRPPAADKESMVCLIERHRKVGARVHRRPRRDDLHRRSVYNRNLFRARDIDEDARTGSFELKGFRMTRKLRLAQDLGVGRIDRCDRTAAVPNVQSLAHRVVPHVIGIVSQGRGPREVIVGAVEPLHVAALTVRHCHALRIRNGLQPLRLVEPWQALRDRAGFEVDHFHRVVAERGDEEPLRRDIDRHVIDTALDAGKIDRPDQNEGLLC